VAADLGGRGQGEDFASVAEVGKRDAGGVRGVHADGARTASGDEKDGPDWPAQQAKGDKHFLGHAIDRQSRYGVAGGCNEYRPARPEFGQRPFNRDLSALTEQHRLRAPTHLFVRLSLLLGSSDALDYASKQSGGILPSGKPGRRRASVRGEQLSFGTIADQAA
jgi:hypothetical protein